MKSILQKISILGAIITTGCAIQERADTASYPVLPETFKPKDKGIVLDAYSIQTCDREIKLHIVEIDANGNGKPDYIGFTDGDKRTEVEKSKKEYPVGKTVSMKKAANYFQWFERVHCKCE